MVIPSDPLFIALARKVGFPPEAALRACWERQQAHEAAGNPQRPLIQRAHEEGLLPDDVARYMLHCAELLTTNPQAVLPPFQPLARDPSVDATSDPGDSTSHFSEVLPVHNPPSPEPEASFDHLAKRTHEFEGVLPTPPAPPSTPQQQAPLPDIWAEAQVDPTPKPRQSINYNNK